MPRLYLSLPRLQSVALSGMVVVVFLLHTYRDSSVAPPHCLAAAFTDLPFSALAIISA